MADFQTEMDRLVSSFVADVTELARRAAINMLSSSLGGAAPRSARRVGGSRGGKRPAEDINRLQDQFVSFVEKNPGLRIEQVNQQLGTRTKDLMLPIRKLIADGTIKTKGKKRSTTYFAK